MKQLVDIKLHDSLPLFPSILQTWFRTLQLAHQQFRLVTAAATNLHQNKYGWWARTEDRDSRSSRLKSYYVDQKNTYLPSLCTIVYCNHECD